VVGRIDAVKSVSEVIEETLSGFHETIEQLTHYRSE